MKSLSMVEAELPAGFRFHPKDEELVCGYLMKKMTLSQSLFPLLIEVDLNKCEPWDIPELACVGGKEWYFYSRRDRKYATGLRMNRATTSGYWKATGKDKDVLDQNILVGMRKTLVFYHGRAPKGRKSDWVMHEFRLEGPLTPQTFTSKEDLVLCKVFHKYKDVIAKSAIARSSYEEPEMGSTSTPLPPLMDSYPSFTRTENNSVEQVPCFSGFSSNKINLHPDLSELVLAELEPNCEPISDIYGGIFIDNTSSPFDLCYQERKVMEMVLNNLSKLDQNPSLKVSPWSGEGSSRLPHAEAETITRDEISNPQFPLR